jgi:signal transduction histidine kinase
LKDRLFRLVFSEWEGALIVLDPARSVLSCSQGAAKLLASPADETEGKIFDPFVPAGERARFAKMLQGSRFVKNVDFTLLSKGGVETRVFLTFVTLTEDGGPLCHVLWLRPHVELPGHDLQDAMLRESILRLQQLSAVGQLTAALAHQIRTPLHVIQSTVELMTDQFDAGNSHLESLKVIDRNVGRIKAVSDALSGFTHHKTHALEPGDLNKVLEQACFFMEMVCKRQNVRLNKSFSDIPRVLVDADYLMGAFYNLMANALEAMPAGGVLTVTTSRKEDGAVAVISDTGEGIDPAVLEHIGDPFFTTKSAGTGLGLYVVKRVLEQHKARLNVESQKDAGTQIVITFPGVKS